MKHFFFISIPSHLLGSLCVLGGSIWSRCLFCFFFSHGCSSLFPFTFFFLIYLYIQQSTHVLKAYTLYISLLLQLDLPRYILFNGRGGGRPGVYFVFSLFFIHLFVRGRAEVTLE
ncbi:hypothetical protein DFH27DRAFT_340250 [Peziza echinospora]|nr:hypothetical protein DFH27DRAFT_340250 [Peziza echinospora]